MKQKIKKVLDRHKDGQGNLSSDSFRDMLAVEIACNLEPTNTHKEMMAERNPLSIEMWKGYKDMKSGGSEKSKQMELELRT